GGAGGPTLCDRFDLFPRSYGQSIGGVLRCCGGRHAFSPKPLNFRMPMRPWKSRRSVISAFVRPSSRIGHRLRPRAWEWRPSIAVVGRRRSGWTIGGKDWCLTAQYLTEPSFLVGKWRARMHLTRLLPG